MTASDPPPPDGPDWMEIKRLYTQTKRPVDDIAREFGVKRFMIYHRRKKESWARRKRVPPPRPAVPAKRPTPRQPGDRRTLIVRLRAAVTATLTRLEARLNSYERSSLADDERTTRTIATLTRTVDKIKELEADNRARRGRTDAASAHGSHDLDRLRRELALRIKTLAERNTP